MNRRLFLQFPLVAVPLALETSQQQKDRPEKGIKVDKDKDRFNENIELGRIGSRIDTKVSSKDCEGDLYIYEGRTAGKGGPPLHIHPHQDEWIHIVQGKYRWQVGEEKFQLQAGDSLLAPRNIPHAFTLEGEEMGKMMIVFQPAGKMEAFFHEVTKQTRKPTPEEEKDLYHRHEMEIVGPALAVSELKYKP